MRRGNEYKGEEMRKAGVATIWFDRATDGVTGASTQVRCDGNHHAEETPGCSRLQFEQHDCRMK